MRAVESWHANRKVAPSIHRIPALAGAFAPAKVKTPDASPLAGADWVIQKGHWSRDAANRAASAIAYRPPPRDLLRRRRSHRNRGLYGGVWIVIFDSEVFQ